MNVLLNLIILNKVQAATIPGLDLRGCTTSVNTALALLLFLIGLLCLLTQRKIIKQVIGLKIMLQGAALSLIHAGRLRGDVRFAEMMVISALVAETIVIAIAVALIVNVFRHYPAGDVDHLDELRG